MGCQILQWKTSKLATAFACQYNLHGYVYSQYNAVHKCNHDLIVLNIDLEFKLDFYIAKYSAIGKSVAILFICFF